MREYLCPEALDADRHLYSNFISSGMKATIVFKEPLVQCGKFSVIGDLQLLIECRCGYCGGPCSLCRKPLVFSYRSWRRFLKLHKSRESIVNPRKRPASVDLDEEEA
jgi:hypothetical protein